MIFVKLLKLGKCSDFILVLSNSSSMEEVYSCHKTDKSYRTLYGFGGRCLNIIDICMDFEPCSKVHNFISVYSKSIKLGQMTNLP